MKLMMRALQNKTSSVDERWKALQNSLSGLFCASLGRMDTLHTTSPTRTFRPTGDLPRLHPPSVSHTHTHTHALRHATLPAERVCTENLTPFLKLLPCPARAGIAALLEPHKIFDADWHGIAVHVRWRAGAGVELLLSVQAVLDPVRISAERRRGEWARGLFVWGGADDWGIAFSDWSLRSLFDRSIPRACAVATSSDVRVVLPSSSEGGVYTLTPEPSVHADADVALYDLTNGKRIFS
jgi:phosphatidylinositol glycan class T